METLTGVRREINEVNNANTFVYLPDSVVNEDAHWKQDIVRWRLSVPPTVENFQACEFFLNLCFFLPFQSVPLNDIIEIGKLGMLTIKPT